MEIPHSQSVPAVRFKRSAFALILLGVYFLLAGSAGYLSNPENAKTALISGGFFGSLCVLLGIVVRLGPAGIRGIARLAGLFLMGLLALVFTWRSSVGWMAVASGEQSKLFAAALITSMLLAALLAATVTLRDKSNATA